MTQTQDATVARAVFVSALLRSEFEAPEISRDDATLFAKTVLQTCNICTSSNIKLCKSFIAKYILPSISRTTALAKYLVTLSKSFGPRDLDKRIETTKAGDDNEGLGKVVDGKLQQPPEPAFKRLHVLYIVHDVLCYAKDHFSADSAAEAKLKADACTLAELAACRCTANAARTRPLVSDVLELWQKQAILTSEQLERTRARVSEAADTEWASLLDKLQAEVGSRVDDQTGFADSRSDWILPKRHGVINDPSAPWHELPAANGLYLMRTRGYPLRSKALPQDGFPLRNGGTEADDQLKKDVQHLYSEVLRVYDKYTDPEEVQDIDALGNVIWKDLDRQTRNYWGFTLDGIEKRKELAKEFAYSATGYAEFGPVGRVNDAVERARMLATERGRGMPRGRGNMGRGSWRGGPRW